MKIYTNSNIGVVSLSLSPGNAWIVGHCWRNLTVLNRRLLAGAQTLLDLIPAISGLSNCSFVYNTFSTIVTQRCTPVKSALRHIWIPLLLLSIALLFLTLSWIIANHRNTQQRYLGTIYAQEYSPKGRPLWDLGREEKEKENSLIHTNKQRTKHTDSTVIIQFLITNKDFYSVLEAAVNFLPQNWNRSNCLAFLHFWELCFM